MAHPHLHCVIPAGGLSPDHTRWIHPRYPFFLPVYVLSRVFRGKFVAGLKRRFQQHQLTFAGSLQPLANEKAFRSFLRPLFRQDWVLLHLLPRGFVRIRSFGFLATRRRARLLPLCQRLLADYPVPHSPANVSPAQPTCFRLLRRS
jgi:hypothetical protein